MAKEISKARRNFRRILFTLTVISALFFASIVTLRMNRSAHWYVAKNYGESLFAFDVIQHQFLSNWQNEDDKHITAIKMINRAVFSKKYADAGTTMIKDLADSGHAPSQTAYGDVLMRRPNEENIKKARYYYHLAANENYPPAIERLALIKPDDKI